MAVFVSVPEVMQIKRKKKKEVMHGNGMATWQPYSRCSYLCGASITGVEKYYSNPEVRFVIS